MNRHLQQFAQQLATWTEAIIEHGRTPFRRVDTYPDLDTEQGILNPPLVFWINRQSMMAGGILLLPDNNLETELKTGRSCASALGLRHFVTWETNQVRIWAVETDKTVEQQSFPLSSPNQPETFRYLLADILEALKLLAVLGAIPATDLSPYYLNNLFQITLEQALPPLIEAYRSQRSEVDEHSPENADTCAIEANRLLLLQMLSLLWFKKIPGAILPEKMETVIELSLLSLPDSLQQALSLKTTIKPPSLPLEAAVCFHHLLLRLYQLSWDQQEKRARESIYRLTEHWFQGERKEQEPASIYLYPETPPLNSSPKVLLSNSPSFLAATALLTEVSKRPQGKIIFGTLFECDQDSLLGQRVSGRLINQTGITSSKRREYTTKLRTAWPNRHLKIATGQPFWRWELTHLLGLCHPEQNLSLELPIDLLNDPENQFVWSLLCENYSFQQIELLNTGNIKISILRSKRSNETFQILLAGEIREMTPARNPTCFKNQLLLALSLPSEIYKFLGNELIWPEPDGIPNDQLPGWDLYSQSHLYKWLQSILQSRTATSTSGNEGTLETVPLYIPYPEPLLLNELVSFGQTTQDKNPSLAIDHFLADLLSCPTIENIKSSDAPITPKIDAPENHSEKQLKETIAQQLSVYGIPNFPEQYLYFLDQPEMIHYTITPPVITKSDLLGQFELEDAKGQIISGYGEELKQILLFCSELEKTEIDLPSDRHQLEQLLQYYQKDLEDLYRHLNNLCYSQVKNSKSARKILNRTWKKLSLPNPSWFKK
ncbi:MAG: hypothetical protein QM483_09100 [Desulfuromusa sp.]